MTSALKSRTDWISPAKEITGQDHLAVQAVGEHVYSGLLPGITNGTDRVRCYSFYAWFVWAFDRHSKKKTAEELTKVFRRAECLHTLIGIVHGLESGGGSEWVHGAGLVGRNTLSTVAADVIAGRTIRLSEFADIDTESEHRYFKHKLGGLGQNYLGALKDLAVLDGGSDEGLKYTREWGGTLAELHDHGVSGDAFFDAIASDRINLKTVRSLFDFCPCKLSANSLERDALLDLLLCRGKGALAQDVGLERRDTLRLLLHHARSIRSVTGHHIDRWGFLASCYTGYLPDGVPWLVPPTLAGVRAGWAIYQRHELLSIAVQGLFWAGLNELRDEGGRIDDALAYATWFAKRFQGAPGNRFANTPFVDLVDSRRKAQPDHSDWESAQHELTLADALLDAQSDNDADTVVKNALSILLSLVARGIDERPYGDFVETDRFFETYEINLVALRRHSRDTWKGCSGREWLEWLASSWALRVHFRVALRKLRYQMQDTFRIVPQDDGYQVREAPIAQWTVPRLDKALRFLHDLAALEVNEAEEGQPYVLTVFGEQLLEKELGGR